MTAALAEVLPQEPETQAAAPAPFLLADQIVFLATFAARCENRSGGVARETYPLVTDEDVRKLRHIAGRTLTEILPHAPALRLLVTGKGKVYEFGKGRKPE